MPQCMGFKTNGSRCERVDNGFIHMDATHLHFCSTHWPVYDRRVASRRRLTVVVAEQHHRPGTCHKWVSSGQRWCGRACQGNVLLCNHHTAAAVEREAARQAAAEEARERLQVILAVEQWYREHIPVMTWQQVVDHVCTTRRDQLRLEDMYQVCNRYFMTPVIIQDQFRSRWQFEHYWRWNINGRNGNPPNLLAPPQAVPPPPQPTNLATIARDRQNVHTTAVSQQTNKGLEKLLEEAKGPSLERAPQWFAARWMLKSYGGEWEDIVRTVNDMYRWYDTRTCRTTNDWLYRRALDGLYTIVRKIEAPETKSELFKRVFEECFESIGMCCDGHISRLCNVLVGFDDTFLPPVPFGEVLQNKMAAIAGLDVETEEKIRQATAFFNEFAVPESDRAAWLEAF